MARRIPHTKIQRWRKKKRQWKNNPPAPAPGARASLIRNEVWAKLRTDDPGTVAVVDSLLKFRPSGYQFMPKYRNGHWDGFVHLFQRRSGTFPGGLTTRVIGRLEEADVDVDIEDRSQPPQQESQLTGGRLINIDLRPYQIEAVKAAIAAKRGVLEAATGTGKTECLGAWIQQTACRTLIIVPSRDLAQQTIRRFQERLHFPNADPNHLYGIVGDNENTSGLITVALYQTLHRRLQESPEETREWLASFDALALDEGHHVAAKSWWPIVNAMPAYWRLGLSATPFKSDPITELKLVGATGEVCFSFKAKDAVEEGWLTKPVVTIVRPNFPVLLDEDRYIDSYRDGIVDHEKRNRLIADIAAGTSQRWGVPTLILVNWIEHGKNIRRSLRQLDLKVDFISGSQSTEERRAAMEALADGTIKCLISSTILDEGVDVPEIGALILTGGGKAPHKVLQRIGRGLRVVEGKEYLAVFDFFDSHSEKYLLGHSRQRLQAVKDAGFVYQELLPVEVLSRITKGDIRP